VAPEPGQRVNLPNGDHVNVYREGSGNPVVLIHGRPGTGRMMLPLARALARLGYSYGGGVARLQLSVPMMRWMMGTEFIVMRIGKAANVAMFHPAPADLRTSSL